MMHFTHYQTTAEDRNMFNAHHYAASQRLEKQLVDHQHMDEADALLLGLEKTIGPNPASAAKQSSWAPVDQIISNNSIQQLENFLVPTDDLLEPYPILTRPNNQERRSSDLRMFLDYVVRPPQTAHQQIEAGLAFQEERKRVLEHGTTPAAKRSRTCNVVENSSDDESADNAQGDELMLPKFRDYQEQQWQEQYAALLEYKGKHGHCCVPNTYKPNPTLGRWVSYILYILLFERIILRIMVLTKSSFAIMLLQVKRQRYQYKLRQAGQQSTLVGSRVMALEDVGFVWDSHAALWEQRLNELKEYRAENGHCNVPSTYPQNPQLSTWVKCQRRQFRLTEKGKNSNLTQERIGALDDLGFVWDGRTIIGNNNNSGCKRVIAETTRSTRDSSLRSEFAI